MPGCDELSKVDGCNYCCEGKFLGGDGEIVTILINVDSENRNGLRLSSRPLRSR